MELNFFEYSDSKKFFVELDVVEYSMNNRLQYDLILGTNTIKELGIMLDFRAKTLTINDVILSMRNTNNLQGASMLRALKLNHSLAMEPQSTQNVTNRATQILDGKYNKADLQSIAADNCKHLSANQQEKLLQLLRKYETRFDGTLGDWKTKPVSFQSKEGVSPYRGQAFPVLKT